MITRRTKIQLIIFALITLLGVSFVGARYARLDRLVVDDSPTRWSAHFPDSGGIFAGAEVAYRGVRVGQVGKLVLTDAGRRRLPRHRQRPTTTIPADTLAVVGNRSAVGEQYVELQPQTDQRPYLPDGSRDPDRRHPHPDRTTKLLTDLDDHRRVGATSRACSTIVNELGKAFDGTGPDLQRIIDTGNSFIHTANHNFDDHHRADPATATPCSHGQIDSDVGDPELRPRPVAVLRHPGRPATRTCAG